MTAHCSLCLACVGASRIRNCSVRIQMVKLIVMARDEGSAVIMVTHDEALVKALDARSINVRGGE